MIFMNKITVESKIPPYIPLQLNTDYLEFCNADYLCIKEPGGFVMIPDNYNNALNPDNTLVNHVRQLITDLELYELNTDECYWYLSVKKGFINPRQYQTKDEWHIDGFLRDDYNFIWSNALPTLLAPGKFELTPNRYTSLNEYVDQVNEVVPSEVNKLYYLDRECVHKPMVNESDDVVVRTFFKLTITKRLFESKGNAWNYLIPHIKATKERTNFV